MDVTEPEPSLAQRRILWWMATTGERPYWISGRASWEGGPRSTSCPHGLGRPHLPRLSVEAMLDAGLIAIEDESYPAHVIPLPVSPRAPSTVYLQARLRGGRQAPQPPGPRLLLTDRGRRLSPVTPPYPWRPNTGGTRDITFSEEERQGKIAAYVATLGRGASNAHATAGRSLTIPSNVVVAAFGARRS